ncbi:MAG: Hemin uptake protein hemP [Pseudomonadota bacterium]|jgi:hemin uptake protein HemP
MNEIEHIQAQAQHDEPMSKHKGLEDTPISSQTLLGKRTWVTIEHLGTLYRLRATRQGKLILTK